MCFHSYFIRILLNKINLLFSSPPTLGNSFSITQSLVLFFISHVLNSLCCGPMHKKEHLLYNTISFPGRQTNVTLVSPVYVYSAPARKEISFATAIAIGLFSLFFFLSPRWFGPSKTKKELVHLNWLRREGKVVVVVVVVVRSCRLARNSTYVGYAHTWDVSNSQPYAFSSVVGLTA